MDFMNNRNMDNDIFWEETKGKERKTDERLHTTQYQQKRVWKRKLQNYEMIERDWPQTTVDSADDWEKNLL